MNLEELAQRLAQALNYSYECCMNEYSMASCLRATDTVKGYEDQAVLMFDKSRDDLVEWSDQYHRWVAKA